MNHPTVSVVVPVRDGARYLAAALDSVLGQTTPPTEVVAVDDGSRDATPEVLAGYGAPVHVVRQSSLGLAAALNRGLQEATGELIGFCDADDLWAPAKQERQLACLSRDADCAGVGGLIVQFVSPDARDVTGNLRVDPRPTAAALLGSLLLRRAQVDRVGTFERSMSFAVTVDWIARARLLGLRLVTLDEVVLLRRVHTENMTVASPEEERHGLIRALRAQRRRHRDAPPTR